MARSLPESTVDAWSAISLAAQGVQWLWLPTTVKGGAVKGDHPGDVSTISEGRLILIENKGIENSDSIDYGRNKHQSALLKDLQALGHKIMNNTPDWRGWVFYGLPTEKGPGTTSPWAGTDFLDFPQRHRLVCPCQVNLRHHSLAVVARLPKSCDCISSAAKPQPHEKPLPWPFWRRSQALDLTLSKVKRFASQGWIGLPINSALLGALCGHSGDEASFRKFLGFFEQEFPDPTREGETVDVLALISNLAKLARLRHPVGAVS